MESAIADSRVILRNVYSIAFAKNKLVRIVHSSFNEMEKLKNNLEVKAWGRNRNGVPGYPIMRCRRSSKRS